MTETKATLMQLFITHLAPVLFTALATGLMWLMRWATKKLHAQANATKAQAVAAKALHFAEVVTSEIEATLRPMIQEFSRDGKISRDEADRLRSTALELLKSMLGKHGLEELRGVLGIAAPQLDVYLSGLIEKAVSSLPSTHDAPATSVSLFKDASGGLAANVTAATRP